MGEDLSKYLVASEYIDHDHPSVSEMASLLAAGLPDDASICRSCFVFVRDEVRHSADHDTGPVTVKASEVLQHQVGFCYAKSHLLAALLRANGIPAGLCYQRLSMGEGQGFCLHGLNAVYLRRYGWFRIDARGNNDTIDARCAPPRERLAFSLKKPGEMDLKGVWEEPLQCVVECLTRYDDHRDVLRNLPDITADMQKIEVRPSRSGQISAPR